MMADGREGTIMDDDKPLLPEANSEAGKQGDGAAKPGAQTTHQSRRSERPRLGSKEHVQAVMEWVEAHERRIPPSSSVTLHAFSVDWSTFSGSFMVLFGETKCRERLSFGPSMSGRPEFYLPMFMSPLGAPASYDAIEISSEAEIAIIHGLRAAIPSLKPYGIDSESRTIIGAHTPLNQRIISLEELNLAKVRLADPQYSITAPIDKLAPRIFNG
jgi:hypothetical protein